MNEKRPTAITKELSRNDTGETGGHQAGILVPRDPAILPFFPELDSSEYNPRIHLTFCDSTGDKWDFAFIYYNNRFYGGTRNEYRLTRMTPFIKAHNLKAGDILTLSRDENNLYYITYTKQRASDIKGPVLKLGNSWKVVKI